MKKFIAVFSLGLLGCTAQAGLDKDHTVVTTNNNSSQTFERVRVKVEFIDASGKRSVGSVKIKNFEAGTTITVDLKNATRHVPGSSSDNVVALDTIDKANIVSVTLMKLRSSSKREPGEPKKGPHFRVKKSRKKKEAFSTADTWNITGDSSSVKIAEQS